MEFINKKNLDVSKFLMQLKGYSVREAFKLPIETSLCQMALRIAFEREVTNNLREYIVDETQNTTLNEIAQWLVEPQNRWGLMLCGIPGTGKTTIVSAIQRIINTLDLEDPITSSSSEKRAASLSMVTAKEMCNRFVENRMWYNETKNYSLLALDELGNEPTEIMSYGNTITPIEDLLEYRYQRRLFTIITTNISQKTIRENYGDRIASRFNEMMYVVNMPPKSFRA